MGQSRSFAIAVGTALRSGPDIIGLETLADAETLAAVQDACRHGALVVAGVPADNSVAALRNFPAKMPFRPLTTPDDHWPANRSLTASEPVSSEL
jgi:hypothetical protein